MPVFTNRTDLNYAAISASASGDNQIVADPGGGANIKVFNYVLIADGTVLATWKGNANASGAMSLIANAGISANGGGLPMFVTSGGLKLNLSAAVGVKGHVAYIVES